VPARVRADARVRGDAEMTTDVRSVERAVVIGAGSWGTTIATLLAAKGLDVALWAREPEVRRELVERGENSRYLPGVALHPGLRAAPSLGESVAAADVVIFAIPAQSLRAVVRCAQPHIASDVVVVNLAKGIEEGTCARCSEIILQELRQSNPVAVLSGPNIAHEVVRGVPSKAVVACNNYRYLRLLTDVFSTPCFKVYENPDLTGTELGGALKNVIAIMAGIGDGLGFGANTKSAVITRGLHEMIRIGVLMGGHRDTFFGLSGIGDLMATALSSHSRNRRLGECLGRGASLAEAEAALDGRVAEGIQTTKALVEIRRTFAIEMPIVETLHRVLFEGLPPHDGYLASWHSRERFEGD
jgi:glycerol-3-phosphate dehydrogenase (NAD(P)+)